MLPSKPEQKMGPNRNHQRLGRGEGESGAASSLVALILIMI